jgi:hypothetical protein
MILGCMLAGGAAAGAFAQQDMRAHFGEQAAVMEAMAAAAFPGATIDWVDQTLTRPEGEPQVVEFVDYIEIDWQDGVLALAAMQFPEEIRAVVGAVLTGEPVPSTSEAPRLVVVQMAPDRTIVETQVVPLDANGLSTECLGLTFSPDLEEPDLPSVGVDLISLHQEEKWAASVVWSAVAKGQSLALDRLIPVAVSYRNRDGGSLTEALDLEETDGGELVLRGQDTGFTWSFTCDPGCIVPAEEILVEYRNRPILAE